MDSQSSMTRKDFLTLTFTLVGGAALAAGCSSSSSGGTGGAAGHAADGGTGGATGTGGAIGTDAAADVKADTKADTATATDTGIFCADPLPAPQVADQTQHVHTLTIPASTLAMTSDVTLQTSGFPPDSSGAHFHTVVLTVANLGALKSGGTVTVTSSLDGDPVHSHMFAISCH
jgi:hypothetical protein